MNVRRWIFVTLGAVTLGGAVWVGSRLAESKVTLARHLPTPPALTHLPVAAQERFRAADRSAREVRGGQQGLAELARLYQANGFFDEALACYEGLREVEPRNARWFHLPAAILAGLGRLEEAEPLFRRAADLAPDYLPARVRAGDVLLKANRLDEAQRIYDETLTRFGEQPYALLGLARTAIARDDWRAAEMWLRRALAVDPNFIGALALLATVEKQLGRDAEAARTAQSVNRREFVDIKDPWVEELMEDCYDPHQLSVAAGVANFRRDPVSATRYLERAASLAPNPAPYLRQLGQIGYVTRDYAAAAKHLARAVALAPSDADAWTVWANVALAAGNRAEAYRVLLDGLSHCPESGSLRYVHGYLLNEDGRVAEAIKELRIAKRFRSTQADVFIELARAYFRTGEIEAGIAEIKAALAIQPDHPAALVVVARHAIDHGDHSAAREWIRRIRLQPRIAAEDAKLVLSEFEQKFGAAP